MKRTKQSTFAKREKQEQATGFDPVASETHVIGFQEKGVIEEYRKAKVVGHTTLAQGIRGANPDLTKDFDKVDKAL